MKNCLVLILSVFFVLPLSKSAFAVMAEIPAETQAVTSKDQTQITLGGEIRVRGWYIGNSGDNSQQYNSGRTEQDDHALKSTPQISTSQTGK